MSSFGASAVIFDGAGRVLLVRDRHEGREHFVPPGGTVEADESPREGAEREVLEECGVVAQAGPLVGVYWSRADRWLSFGFLAAIQSGAPVAQAGEGILALGWFDPENLPTPTPTIASALIADAVAGKRGVYREI